MIAGMHTVNSPTEASSPDSIGSLQRNGLTLIEGSCVAETVVNTPDFSGIIGQSSALRDVLQLVEMVAGTDTTVLLLGETGTGKELIGRAIHERSRRQKQPFVNPELCRNPELVIRERTLRP